MNRRRLLTALAMTAAAAFPGAAMASGAGKEENKAERQEPYILMPTLTATVMKADGRRGVMTVQATLYVPRADQRMRAAKGIPWLMNAFVPALQSFAYSLPPGTPPNVDILARGLQDAADRVLGPGSKVLLGGVLVT